MREMKTFGGYEVVDAKSREDIEVLQENLTAVSEQLEETSAIAKGATRAFVYDTYSDMISELNKLPKTELQVNYHVMIRDVYVPDLWVSGVSDEHIEYTYTSNEDFIVDLTEDGIVQVGYFVLSALETQKVDLSEYVKNTDYASNTVAGVVKTYSNNGVSISPHSHELHTVKATQNDIDSKVGHYKPIVPSMLDYAVMKALSDSKLEWTDEQKQLARALLGAIGSNNVTSENGLAVLVNGQLIIAPPIHSLIDDRDKDSVYSQRKAVTLSVLDYAVKKALSDCKLTGDDAWTEEEKAKALELLGGVAKPVTPTSTSVIAIDTGGNITTLRYTTAPANWCIPLYDGSGNLKTNTPTEDIHATTKKYVDDLVASTKDSISLKDLATGQAYNVRINNGVLEMVLDEEVK